MFIYYKRDRFLNFKKKNERMNVLWRRILKGKIKNVKIFLIFRRDESYIVLIWIYLYGILIEIFFYKC